MSEAPSPSLNDLVRQYWEASPNEASDVPNLGGDPREWFDAIEERRYRLEPFIHQEAQFTRHHGKDVLEVGVGAGTDHLQWARAGANCFGIDITAAAIDLTWRRLELYGFTSSLQQSDAQVLPFADESFDVVYSWGVIHHAADPASIVDEIHRVLRPGGTFIGMMYNRRSIVAGRLWIRHALLRASPRTTLAQVIWDHMESVGTKAYTRSELKGMFGEFARFAARPVLTPYDLRHIPSGLAGLIPDRFGWFYALRAQKG